MENEYLTAKSHYKSVIYIGNCRAVPKPFSRTQTKLEPMLYHVLSYLFPAGPFSHNDWVQKNKKFDCRKSLVEWGERLLNCLLVVLFFAEVVVKVNLQQKVSQQEHICENHSYHLITEILVAA